VDTELLIRLTVIVLGIFFLILSAAGAILELARRAGDLESAANPLAGITKLLEALKALFSVLAAAPTWLGLGGFGVLLIVLGALLPLPF
jgi:hypothetical protein